MIKNSICGLVFWGGTEMGGAFWFIGVLAKVSVMFCLEDWIGRKCGGDKLVLFIQAVVALFLLFLGYNWSVRDLYFEWGRVFSSYILFFMGYVLCSTNALKRIEQRCWHVLVFLISFVVLLVCNNKGSVSISHNSYENPLFFITVSLAGWMMLWEMSKYIENKKQISGMMQVIGKNTMSIVILHFLAFKIVSYLGVLWKKDPHFLVAAFPVLYTDGAWWVLYTLVGVLVPIAMSLIYKKLITKLH